MIAGTLLKRVATRGLINSSSTSKFVAAAPKAAAAVRFFSSDVATFDVEGSFEV